MLNEKKFRFWCQTVLPLVYDDSLSYYELLNKVVTYLNNTIQDVQDISDDYQEFEESVNTQLATLTQDMTTLANTVGQFDDRITLNTNEIHILDNEMEDTLQYEGVVTTFPNPTKYGFYKVPEGHDATFPEDHVAGSLIIISDSQGETFTATYLTNTGRVYSKMKNALGWSEWSSEDVANQERIAQSNQNIEELQEEDIKVLKYRGFTIRQEDLGELPTADPPQCYRSGYYTPKIGQGDMPTGETITAQNQYRYLITVINNFLRDPADIVDRSERTWILYGPNAKMWWAHGSRPRPNTWSVFDPSAIDVSNLEQMVQALSAQYEAVDDRMDDIEGAVTTNTNNISRLTGEVATNTQDISSLNTRVTMNTGDIDINRQRISQNARRISDVESEIESNEYYQIGETIGNFYGWCSGSAETATKMSFTVPILKKCLPANTVKFTPLSCKLGFLGTGGHIEIQNYQHDFLNDSDYSVRITGKGEGNMLLVEVTKLSGNLVYYGTSQAVTPATPAATWINDLVIRCDNP